MIDVTTGLEYAVGLLAVAGSGYFLVTMWERRTEPAARTLLAIALLLFVGAVVHLGIVASPTIEQSLTAQFWSGTVAPVWAGLFYVLAILCGGLWFLFTLQYTGRGGRLFPVAAAMVLLLWIGIFGAAAFGDLSPPADVEGESAELASAELALSIGVTFMFVILAIGVFLVLTTSLERNALPFREALTLSGGAAVIVVGLIVGGNLFVASSVSVTVGLASGLFALAVRRYPAFEAPPVARIAGRDRLIEEMEDAVVVVDLRGRIRDLNPAGVDCFDVDRADGIDEPLSELFSSAVDPVDVEAATEPVQLQTADGHTMSVTANRIRDARDRSFGHLLVCRDITDRKRRERRLSVLNQLLTGAISDRMETVADSASAVTPASRDDSPAERERELERVGREIRTKTTELVELVALTREIERALARAGSGRIEVEAVLENVIEGIDPDRDVDLEFTVEGDPSPTATSATVLETIVETLLADALEHGRERVELQVLETDGGPEVHLVDDRPTSGDERGSEPPFDGTVGAPTETASGAPNGDDPTPRSELTVEMVRQATRHIGGDVSVQVSDCGNQRTVVELPMSNGRIDEIPASDEDTGPQPDSTVEIDRTGGERQ